MNSSFHCVTSVEERKVRPSSQWKVECKFQSIWSGTIGRPPTGITGTRKSAINTREVRTPIDAEFPPHNGALSTAALREWLHRSLRDGQRRWWQELNKWSFKYSHQFLIISTYFWELRNIWLIPAFIITNTRMLVLHLWNFTTIFGKK